MRGHAYLGKFGVSLLLFTPDMSDAIQFGLCESTYSIVIYSIALGDVQGRMRPPSIGVEI